MIDEQKVTLTKSVYLWVIKNALGDSFFAKKKENNFFEKLVKALEIVKIFNITLERKTMCYESTLKC